MSDDSLDPVAVALGSDIRGLRKTKGLTLAELAELTGRSVGFLSQIERGLKKPSVGTLQSLGDALGLGIGWFLQGTEGGATTAERTVVVRRNQRRRLSYTGLSSTDYLGMQDWLVSPDLNANHGLVVTTYEPGASTGDDLNGHEGEESGMVLSGTIVLDLGDERYTLETGDSFHFDSAIPHRYSNPGKEPASTIMALVPMALRYGHAHSGDNDDNA
ncbi:MAG: Cro/Cl family transcriptional regulator [Rhodospirillaceae bacterium]|nr:Cro/Cl family transcriptional regulator [Rhodospirillaceae bacterium]|tara:strand:- start:27755 stop:28402 length:648 start_codon:yes stop_codon:yes gene_type:complete